MAGRDNQVIDEEFKPGHCRQLLQPHQFGSVENFRAYVTSIALASSDEAIPHV